jgi:hypothetical protein
MQQSTTAHKLPQPTHMHGESFDFVFRNDLLLTGVQFSQSNVDNLQRIPRNDHNGGRHERRQGGTYAIQCQLWVVQQPLRATNALGTAHSQMIWVLSHQERGKQWHALDKARQEGHWHSMDVARWRRGEVVDVRVSVHPNHTNVRPCLENAAAVGHTRVGRTTIHTT